jgi:hypothetical protein
MDALWSLGWAWLHDVIIPAQGEFGSDIPAGDGKLANLLLTVYIHKKLLVKGLTDLAPRV